MRNISRFTGECPVYLDKIQKYKTGNGKGKNKLNGKDNFSDSKGMCNSNDSEGAIKGKGGIRNANVMFAEIENDSPRNVAISIGGRRIFLTK